MAFYLSPIGNSQIVDVNGNPLSGGKIYTYVAGSSTPTATYTDSTGATQQANPIILNTLGLPDSPIWLDQSSVKFVIKDENDVQQGNVYDTIYGIAAQDASSSFDEWVLYNTTVTYITPTSFSVVGDQRAIFQVNRRVKSQNTSGLAYSTIAACVYSAPNTTVTLTNTSGALDAGLSSVYYGFLAAQNSSVPAPSAIELQQLPIQVTYTQDLVGGSTTSTAFATVSGTSFQISPKKATSNLIIAVTFQARSSKATAANHTAQFQIFEGATALSYVGEIGNVSGSGILSIASQMTLMYRVPSAGTTVRSFLLRAKTADSTVSVSATGIIATITEVNP